MSTEANIELLPSYVDPAYARVGKRVLFAEEGFYVATLKRIEDFGRESLQTGIRHFTAVFEIDDARFGGLQLTRNVSYGPPNRCDRNGKFYVYHALDVVHALHRSHAAELLPRLKEQQQLFEADLKPCIGRKCAIEVKHRPYAYRHIGGTDQEQVTATVNTYITLEDYEQRLGRKQHRWPAPFSLRDGRVT